MLSIEAFSTATFSSEPSFSRCVGPIEVITPMLGLAIFDRCRISPGAFEPISQMT